MRARARKRRPQVRPAREDWPPGRPRGRNGKRHCRMNGTAMLKDAAGKVRAARPLVKNPDSVTTLVAVSAALQRVLELERETAKQNETPFDAMKRKVSEL